MTLLLAAVGALALAALLPVLRAGAVASAAAGAIACAVGLAGAIFAQPATWEGPWALPIGALKLGVDPLSALFLTCLFGAGLAGSIYGAVYLPRAWAASAFNVLLACVALVFLARDGVFFLLAWEGMTLSGFLLVACEHERAEVRSGALWFLVFGHFGVACLFAYFALPTAPAAALLLLALAGFGTKMGLAPLHAWLPAAHPVAPSHVSALLSGVLLKAGAYGLFRAVLTLNAPAWFGWVLVGIGAATALLGAINLLAPGDLKRALAYSSIENVGIIAMGLGLGVVGVATQQPLLAAFGLAGALLHVLSHAAFKSLLFSAAGAVLHGTGTRSLEKMGGLAKRMPLTAALFALGAASAAAIPGLAGFASEFFVYRGLFEGIQHRSAACAAALAALALTGGLAAAGLARLYGIAFSGSPRSSAAADAHEDKRLAAPMLLLAAACVLLGLAPAAALKLVAPVLAQFGASLPQSAVEQATRVGELGALFALLALTLWFVRELLIRERATGPTWGCGYAAPNARMQYSAASFTDTAASAFPALLKRQRDGRPSGLFPGAIDVYAESTDRVEHALYVRGLAWSARKLGELRALHRPRLQNYLLYVFVALVLLLSYAARLGR